MRRREFLGTASAGASLTAQQELPSATPKGKKDPLRLFHVKGLNPETK